MIFAILRGNNELIYAGKNSKMGIQKLLLMMCFFVKHCFTRWFPIVSEVETGSLIDIARVYGQYFELVNGL
jgi:hypothetical protein